jgi:hypothetical protein
VPFNWTRCPTSDTSKVTSLETVDNPDGTSWVLIDVSENHKITREKDKTFATVDEAKQKRPFPTSG